MNKRKLHHLLVVLRPIRYRYLIIIFLLSGLVAVYALRQNNLTALRLRDEVLEQDKFNGDAEGALHELRKYTYSHMNARLSNDTGIYPPIQLKYRYERLVAAEKERVAGVNAGLYHEAQAHCEASIPQGLSGGNRVACIEEYVDTHGGAQEKPIPDAMYKFDFVAPYWSPDFAGWSLVICGTALFLLVLRFLSERWLRHQLD
jgi:hypothetical protein